MDIYVFNDAEIYQLTQSYLRHREQQEPDVIVPEEEVNQFLLSCQTSLIEAEAIKLVSYGTLNIHWDKETDEFQFDATPSPPSYALHIETTAAAYAKKITGH